MGVRGVSQIILNQRHLADVVKLVHLTLMLFILTGWLMPWKWVWTSIIILVPALHIHWITNNNVCILTTIEWRLRGMKATGGPDQDLFIANLFYSVFGWKISPGGLKLIIYFTMYFCAAICLARIFFSAA